MRDKHQYADQTSCCQLNDGSEGKKESLQKFGDLTCSDNGLDESKRVLRFLFTYRRNGI